MKAHCVSVGLLALTVAGGCRAVAPVAPEPPPARFVVYSDAADPHNRFGVSGGLGDYDEYVMVVPNCQQSPRSGKTCVRVSQDEPGTNGWAGGYWLHPKDNWGTVADGGYDLSGAMRLTFWARGAHGGEVVEFKMGGVYDEFGDSAEATTGPVKLGPQWAQYAIDLKGFDLSRVVGGFAWIVMAEDNPEGYTFFIDDIAYEMETLPPGLAEPAALTNDKEQQP